MADLPVIERIDEQLVRQTEGNVTFPVIAYAGIDTDPDTGDRTLRGLGGLAWRFDRCWLWFRRLDDQTTCGTLLVRQARGMLRRAQRLGNSEVYCWRDDTIEGSKRLLEVIGLRFEGMDRCILTDGTDIGERELWVWRAPDG